MLKIAKRINDNDNVMIALSDLVAGEEVKLKYKGNEIAYKCNQDIPFGHKIALSDIKKGEMIIKYGSPIGSATQDIQKGDWVHTHNVKDDYKVLDKEGKPLPGQGN
jgi:altronate dehydratase